MVKRTGKPIRGCPDIEPLSSGEASHDHGPDSIAAGPVIAPLSPVGIAGRPEPAAPLASYCTSTLPLIPAWMVHLNV